MDNGKIVFVPEEQPNGGIQDLKWRIIVTDTNIMDQSIFPYLKETTYRVTTPV